TTQLSNGLQWGFVNYNAGNQTGLQLAAFNYNAGTTNGLQLAGFNYAESAGGLQLAFINYARKLGGVQIGAINIASEGGTVPVMGIANWKKERLGWLALGPRGGGGDAPVGIAAPAGQTPGRLPPHRGRRPGPCRTTDSEASREPPRTPRDDPVRRAGSASAP